MKTTPVNSPMSLSIILLILLFSAIAYIGVAGKKVPLLSSIRLDMILLVAIGMTICSQGGIGRIAAAGQWSHPLSILGYLLGGLILLVALSVFVGWKLPFIHSDQQALLVIAILAAVKLVNALIHAYVWPGAG